MIKFKESIDFTLFKSHLFRVAEELFEPESKMMQELRLKNDFEFNSGTGEEVYQKIINCDKPAINVELWVPFNPWTKAIGYYDGKSIKINSMKIGSLSRESFIGLLVHEWLHYGPEFNHGTGRFRNYKTQFKIDHSVNYYCSENISKWL